MKNWIFLASLLTLLLTGCRAQDTTFTCNDGTQIPRSFKCDGANDCPGGFDERNCTGLYTPLYAGTVPCDRADAVRCGVSGACVRLSEMCDGVYDCPDSSDESFGGPGFKCVVKSAVAVPCVLPQENLRDARPQCVNSADLCFDDAGALTYSCFQCLDKKHVISTFQVCDGILDCSDFSDECLCPDQAIPEVCHLYSATEPKCLFTDADVNYISNFDYYSYSGPGTQNQQKWLKNVTIPCGDGQCVTSNQLCDDYNDCLNGLDENYCYSSSTRTHLFTLSSQISPSMANSSVAGFFNRTVARMGPNSTMTCQGATGGVVVAVKCDGRPTCENLSDECRPECGKLPPFCNVNLSCLFTPYICDGLWQTDQHCGFRIPEEELGCPNRFYCKSGPAISIDISQRCDGLINCDDESDESVAQNCTDGRFYCESRNPNDTSPLNILFVPENLKLNGRAECLDGSDECPSVFDSDEFSSREEMVKSLALRIILWFIAPIALVANVVVLAMTVQRMRKRRRTDNAIAKSHSFMIANLSFADGTMGIYLTILCISSAVHSGNYCLADKEWRTSVACRVMGSLVLLSSEASVLILLIMGLFRLYTIYQPFEANFSAKSGFAVRVAVIASWLTSLMLATLPWVLDAFFSHAWFPSPFFRSDVISADTYDTFKLRLSTFRLYLSQNVESPPNSTLKLSSEAVSFEPRGWLGYYSQNGVCLPNFFTHRGDPGWQLTIFLVTFNFVAFICMVIVYSLIWHLSTSRAAVEMRRNVPKGKLNYQKCKLQSRVTRLLFTDFLCWIPLCSMAYAFFAGVVISDVAYAVAGIILLPINSALNPLLYSGVCDKLMTKCTAMYKARRVGIKRGGRLELSETSGASSSQTPGRSLRYTAENTPTTSLQGTPQLNTRKEVVNTVTKASQQKGSTVL